MRKITGSLILLFGFGISLFGAFFYGYKKGLNEKSAEQVTVSLPLNLIVYNKLEEGNTNDVSEITVTRIKADLSVLDYLHENDVDINTFVSNKTKFDDVVRRARNIK